MATPLELSDSSPQPSPETQGELPEETSERETETQPSSQEHEEESPRIPSSPHLPPSEFSLHLPPCESSPHPPPSTSPSPPPSMPAFMSALNLRPKDAPPNGTTGNGRDGTGEGAMEQQESTEGEEKMETTPPHVTLMEKFKQDPKSVLDLLQAALSIDKLASLIKEEYHSDREQLEQLQGRLEEAYKILKDSSEQKEVLTTQIEETNQKVRNKRKHLENLREELKVLGEEELQLKKRRDASYGKCSELKRKLKSSRDALQQIAALSAKSSENSGTAHESKKTVT